jgi:hypothetical protein
MGRRRLVKLLYLIDRELCGRFCCAMFSWKLYRYGPTSREVLNALDDLLDRDVVDVVATSDDVVYRLVSATAAGLPRGVRKAADKVLETWARRSFEELAEYVNSLEEVRGAWPGKRLLC